MAGSRSVLTTRVRARTDSPASAAATRPASAARGRGPRSGHRGCAGTPGTVPSSLRRARPGAPATASPAGLRSSGTRVAPASRRESNRWSRRPAPTTPGQRAAWPASGRFTATPTRSRAALPGDAEVVALGSRGTPESLELSFPPAYADNTPDPSAGPGGLVQRPSAAAPPPASIPGSDRSQVAGTSLSGRATAAGPASPIGGSRTPGPSSPAPSSPGPGPTGHGSSPASSSGRGTSGPGPGTSGPDPSGRGSSGPSSSGPSSSGPSSSGASTPGPGAHPARPAQLVRPRHARRQHARPRLCGPLWRSSRRRGDVGSRRDGR